MTLENLLSQMGIGTKQLTDRYSGEYGAPAQDPHNIYYAYEPSPPSHGHPASSKHHYSGSSGLKSNASMSALTLLAFLFFLHILQQCIKEHMMDMSTAPVVVMSASKEGNNPIPKLTSKLDKSGGAAQFDYDDENPNPKTEIPKNPFINVKADEDKMTRINAAEHYPRIDGMYGYVYKNDRDTTSFPGFVKAMSNDHD